MRKALRLAERGWGRVQPNPLVGALVVREGEIVAEGYHAEFGGPHAEVAALRAAGERARGATLYVTLEPCAHRGKTPPCTEAIVRAGIARVAFAASDPHTAAQGGALRLAAHGIEVEGGVEEAAARELNAPFFHQHERGGPYVALKLALTLDARVSRRVGERTRITGDSSARAVQYLRAGFGAIMVGMGTVLADDPLLTVRGRVRPRVPPARIILDATARLPVESRLVATTDEAPVWIFCAETADRARTDLLEQRGVRIFRVPDRSGEVALEAVLHVLSDAGIQSLLCEGGARVAVSLLRSALVQRLYLFYAPRVFGKSAVDAFPFEDAESAAAQWRLARSRRYGDDVLLTLDRKEA
jgi:diaminohydroxyphosphoribosylaminopyrimidine deaminase/5-amino-6-(5-phosphoribosylamino)uracil reductase